MIKLGNHENNRAPVSLVLFKLFASSLDLLFFRIGDIL